VAGLAADVAPQARSFPSGPAHGDPSSMRADRTRRSRASSRSGSSPAPSR